MNILTFAVHEGWETCWAKTGHNFFVMNSDERPSGFKTSERQKPNNINSISSDEAFRMCENDKIDILVIHTPNTQRLLGHKFYKFGLPIIEMQHCKPHPAWNSDIIRKIKDSSYADISVFICGHTVDDSLYKYSYTGDNEYILSVGYDFIGRKEILGYDLWRQIIRGFKNIHLGDENVENGVISNAKDMATVYYPQSRLYLNTSVNSTLPTSMLEAMATGLPVITVANDLYYDIFSDGISAMLFDDPFDAREQISELMNDLDKAKEIGAGGYKVFMDNYETKYFVNNWNHIFSLFSGNSHKKMRILK